MLVRLPPLLILVALVAGCGSSDEPTTTATATEAAQGSPRLDFGYDVTAPLDYLDHGRANPGRFRIAVHDVSFRSQGRRLEGYLLLPPGSGRRPAVVLVHGSGGDRTQLLSEAASLAARNVVVLTITEPSTSSAPIPSPDPATYIEQVQDVQLRDVVAVRRAVDVLQTLPSVDPERIGYLGWSAGGKTGTFVAAAEPRVKALALLSTGAAPLSAFVANAPANLRTKVSEVLGSVDPLRYIAYGRADSVLLEDGRNDEVVPRSALLGMVNAAPEGATVRWYDAPHALNAAAYRDAFTWLARKLGQPNGGG